MKSLSLRAQLWFIGFGYAAVVALAAALILGRYLQEITHPADVSAYSGMYAGGDLILGIFIVCLFMIPTFFLVWVMAGYETVYTTYCQLLLGLSLSAPVCLRLFFVARNHGWTDLIDVCLYRLLFAPFILVGFCASRLLAHFRQAKKTTSYAMLIEGITLGIAVALLLRR